MTTGLRPSTERVAPASPAQLRLLAVNYTSLGVIAKLDGDELQRVAVGAKSMLALADELEGVPRA